MPKITKFSELLGVVTWASVLVESWMLLMRTLPVDALSITFLVLFFIIGIACYGDSRNMNTGPVRLAKPGLCTCKVRNVTIETQTRVPICRDCGKVRLDESDVK